MRLLPLLAAAALLAPAPAAAATTRASPQSDRAYPITSLRGDGIPCPPGLKVATRPNRLRCFVNGDTCTHTYRGRRWRCRHRRSDTGSRVSCTSRRKLVIYRGP